MSFHGQDGNCAAGTQWYVCNTGGFKGCCSVNACELGTCPDDSTHQNELRTVTLPGPPAATATTYYLTSLPSTTLPWANLLVPTSTGIYTVTIQQSSAAQPTGAGSSKAATSSAPSKVPIIVGATIGTIVFIVLVGVSIWFFLRRRRERRILLTSRGMTPMLGVNDEKSDPANSRNLRGNGGIFNSSRRYHKALSIDEREPMGDRHSMEIEEEQPCDIPFPSEEKKALSPPPDHEHPAYHPLPGKQIPAYVPIQPAYNTLPSQRSRAPSFRRLPDQSPHIPDFVFSPIALNPAADQLDPIPVTPQAELAASPIPTRGLTSSIPSSKFSTARMSPPRTSPPRAPPPRAPLPQTPPLQRRTTPPRNSSPLSKLTQSRGSPPQKITPPTNSAVRRISESRLGYPSPTAGGKAELPASMPPSNDLSITNDEPIKAPLNPTPAFHHIYLPESLDDFWKDDLTDITESIPIGLEDDSSNRDSQRAHAEQEQRRSPQSKQGKPQSRQEQRSSPSPVPEKPSRPKLRQQRSDVSALSDYHHTLREQPSGVSALTVTTEEEPPTHNHSRQWSASERGHVTSWQVYKGDAPIGQDEVSPLFSPQSAAARQAQWSDMGDMSVQPLNLQGRDGWTGREGWSAVPLTPMTPLDQRRALRHKERMK